MSSTIQTITRKQVVANFPRRPHNSHKGMFGTVTVIGGASGMIGASLLAARAALKMGAGCVHVGLRADNAPSVDTGQLELMLHQAAIAIQLGEVDVLAIGCGLGSDLEAQNLLLTAIGGKLPLVLDADALNILAIHPHLHDLLLTRQAPTVITPHPGEAARLLGCETSDVQSDRSAAVQELAHKLMCSVVLKGADSLCFTRTGQLYANKTGNPGMSGPGMGDVLTGMIAAFIAQGMSADDALLLAVHLHGAAGDTLAEKQAGIGMTSTELTDWARWLLNQWLHN